MKKVDVVGDAWALEAVRVAQLYYHEGLTQEEVAHKLGLTRWKVNRMLAQARESGIVRIEVVPPRALLAELESNLEHRYGLRDCVVIAHEPNEERPDEVGRAAASYLAELPRAPDTLAVSWGRTMDAVAEHVQEGWASGVRVVLANGALSRFYSPTGAAGIAERIAEAGAGTAQLLAGPAICEHADTCRQLENDMAITQVLEPARKASVAIFGLGAIGKDSVLVRSGFLTPDAIEDLEARGVVGDVLGRFIDYEGAIADPALDARTLGLTRDDLRAKDYAIGVAAGSRKREVIRAALRGGWINVLVTDVSNARALLEEPT